MKTKKQKEPQFIGCRKIGRPLTVGALSKLLKRYRPGTSFGFRNQPMQSLYEIKYSDKIFVVFQ